MIQVYESLVKAQDEGSSAHYESLLKQRQAGKGVVRRRNESVDSPFDDEGNGRGDEEDIDAMTISNFSKRYIS